MSSDDVLRKVLAVEDLFRTTVENIPVNLLLVDRACRVLYLNPQLARMVRVFHADDTTLIGRHGSEVWPAMIWDPLRDSIERALATRERQTYELAVPTTTGRMVRQWMVVPVIAADGEVDQVLAMSHDITAERRLLDEAREADRRKSEFIAVLSHELRNPLAVIKTGLYVLDHGSTDTADWARETIDRQVGHLVRMVDDLLDITRITRNKIQLTRGPLELDALIRETLDDFRSNVAATGVIYQLALSAESPVVDGDRARLAQVLTNLLSNATKFTGAGGSITISTEVAADRAVLRVRDTGAGIEPALLPRLFEPFLQADRTLDRSAGGLGLGLALVKGLVELHGGTVEVHSDGVGCGAQVTVRLPLAAPATPAAAPPAAPTVRPRRILLIEDNAEVAAVLRVALRLDAHEVEVARTGRDGIAMLPAFQPDLVLCDIGLPGMDGYTVARTLRADRAHDAIRIIALSGYAQPEDLERARQAGFDDHLAKPVDMTRLKDILAGLAPRPRTPDA